ncbi:hypothetical protein BpHYR1_043268 [Brachionus plicatilis]|uniref:Uncharacterized protein n=1 Tax=Brachionus plicatilis TaxID=10195 RepID=A0A3M7P539_BRAPC|nr:hypothetical protein BpHYR1_043268 [Brachionus plicatilis]
MNTLSQNLFEATGNDQVPAQEFAGHNQIVDSRRNYIFLDDKPVSNLIQIKTKQTSKISKRSKPENKAIGINAKNKVSETKSNIFISHLKIIN